MTNKFGGDAWGDVLTASEDRGLVPETRKSGRVDQFEGPFLGNFSTCSRKLTIQGSTSTMAGYVFCCFQVSDPKKKTVTPANRPTGAQAAFQPVECARGYVGLIVVMGFHGFIMRSECGLKRMHRVYVYVCICT